MRKIKKTIEIAPLFLKDFEKMKLSQNIKNKILSDIENIENGRKIPKPLTGAMFPLKELKYLKWGIRIVFIELENSFIFLSIKRKKDWQTRAYGEAIKRIKKWQK